MIRMISGANTVTNSTGLKLPKPINNHALYVTIVDANNSITALTVALQASPSGWDISDDNATWIDVVSYNLTSGDLSAKKAVVYAYDKPARRVRAAITAVTGADAGDSINVYYEGI